MASSLSALRPVNEILSQLAVEAGSTLNEQLIADKVFEKIQLDEGQFTGTILVENSRNYMGAGGADVNFKRAAGAARARLDGFDFTTLTFQTEAHGLEAAIAYEDLVSSQYPIDMKEREIRRITRALLLEREVNAANLLFGTSNWTGYNNTLSTFNSSVNTDANGTQWNSSGAEPLIDLFALADTVRANSHGIMPDTLVMGHRCFRALQSSPDVLGLVGTFGSGLSNAGRRIVSQPAAIEVLKEQLGIPNIFVGTARRETANPYQTSSEAQIWTDDSIFCGIMRGSDAVVNRGQVKAAPLAAVCLENFGMKSGEEPYKDIRTDVWVEHRYQDKVLSSNYGYLLTDILA